MLVSIYSLVRRAQLSRRKLHPKADGKICLIDMHIVSLAVTAVTALDVFQVVM